MTEQLNPIFHAMYTDPFGLILLFALIIVSVVVGYAIWKSCFR